MYFVEFSRRVNVSLRRVPGVLAIAFVSIALSSCMGSSRDETAINGFTAAKATISLDTSTTLTANFTGGVATINNGVGIVTTNTPVTVSPTVTTSYTLTVTNADKTVSAQITVTVVPPPSISVFGADGPVTAGGSTNLTATFADGLGSVDFGVGSVISGTPVPVSPTVDTTYTLTVTNAANDSVTAQATVLVHTAPTITGFTTTNSVITTGASTALTPVFVAGAGIVASINNGVGTVTSGTPVTVSPIVSTTYTLTVSNAIGATATAQVTITVVPPPAITGFTAASTTITVGSSTNLTAVFANGTGTVDNGVGTVTSGTPVTVTPAANKTYMLTVTNAAGTMVTGTVTVTVVSAPVITSFTAGAVTITAGTSTNLTAVFANGTGTVDNSVGTVTSGTPVTVTPAANKTYMLTVTNAAGTTMTAPVTVNVVAAPTITSFTASATTITEGNSTNLTAVFANGTGSIDGGVGVVTSGQVVPLSPTATTTYTLTVTNAATTPTTVTRQITVTVVPAGNISSFTAAATTITAGSLTTLTAVFSGGTGTIDNGVGTITNGASVPISPAATTTYTLTVTNAAGDPDTRLLTVTVVPPVNINSFAAAATTITLGNSTTLTAVFTSATGETGTVDQGVGPVSSSTPVTVTPGTTTIYTLMVTNTAGSTDTRQVTVTVVPVPTRSLTPASITITNGTSTNLTVAFSNANGETAVIDNGIGTVTSGQVVPVGPTTTTTYTLTVTNAAGDTFPATSTVTVVPVPTRSLTPASITITNGTSTNLTVAFSNLNGETAVIDNGIGTVTSGQVVSVSPTTTTTYTLTVTNAAGDTFTATSTVTVVAAPTITSFIASAATITAGGSVNLTAVFANGTGTVDNGGGTVTSGAPVTVTPAATTTYTLTVSNAATTPATVTQQVTVTVVPVPSITSFTAAALTITLGSSTDLTAVFANGTGSIDNGVGVVTSGTPVTVSPTTTTTYTLTVSNAATTPTTVTAQVTVTVVAAPTITSFIASAATITAGGSVNLTAVFANGTGSIDSGVGVVTSNTPVTVNPMATTTYTLTVTNAAGTAATLTVTVTVVPVPSVSLTPAAITITSGDPVDLTATFDNANGETAAIDQAVGVVTSGQTITRSPTADTIYTLTVTNAAGDTFAATSTVTVVPAPTITSFTAGAVTITAGTSTNLTAVFANGTGSIDNGVGAATSGTAVTVTPAATTIYTLTVSNAATTPTTVTAQVTVTVVPVPTITSFTAAAPSIVPASSTTLTAVFSNANGETAAIDTGVVGPVISGTAYTVTPAATTTYTLTVTNAATNPATATATVTVNVVPVVLDVSYGLKQLQFSWTDVGADHYKLWEDVDGTGGAGIAQQVGGNLTTTSYTHPISVHLRPNATYYVQSCDASDSCGNSNTMDVTSAIAASIGYFKGSDTSSSDQFGHGVALSSNGTTLAVGARTAGGSSEGAVYVFTSSGGTWTQEAKIQHPLVEANADFGDRVALSSDGNTLAIGIYGDDTAATGVGAVSTPDCGAGTPVNCALDSGAAAVFTRAGSSWSLEAYIKASNTFAGDGFGWALALSHDGNTLAVAAPFENSAATGIDGNQVNDCFLADGITPNPTPTNCAVNSGASYVFTRSGAAWTQQAYVKSAATTAAGAGNFGFGIHLALNGSDGNTLAVGAAHEGSTFGRAYVYLRSGTAWSAGTAIAPGTGSGGAFGSAVSLSDDATILAIGAEGESSIASAAGAAYIFTRPNATSTAWTEAAFLTASNAGAGDWFGYSLALSGDGSTLIVGADQEASAATGINGDETDNSAGSAGAVYLFTAASGWNQQAYIKAPNARAGYWFGRNLTLNDDGSVMAVGSRFENTAAQGIGGNQTSDCGAASPTNCAVDAGAVYLY